MAAMQEYRPRVVRASLSASMAARATLLTTGSGASASLSMMYGGRKDRRA
jgi:hypothetical protein